MPYIAPEGIVFKSRDDGTIDETDIFGTYHSNEVLGLSKSKIETMDLISEGPIEGLVSGRYIYSGNLGEIGWSKVEFEP